MNNANANPAQEQLLQQLRDVHQPDAISWWPLAPGWWIIIGLVLIILLLLVIRAYLKKRHYRYVRLAVAELKQLQSQEESRWLAQSHHIMRRLSLCYLGDDLLGHMKQSDWLEFLRTTGKQQFSDETVDAFVDLPYKPAEASANLNKKVILTEIINWASNLPEQIKQWHKEQDDV